MKVLIVAKTKMSDRICVGAITIEGKFIRLLTNDGNNQPEGTKYAVRQVWDLEFDKKIGTKPPHIEDVLVRHKIYKRTLAKEERIIDIISKLNTPIVEGNLCIAFDNKLKWTQKGSGYINNEGIPAHSVCFWKPDKDLILEKENEKVYYVYKNSNYFYHIRYKGLEEEIELIPNGTLIRLSLARWWNNDDSDREDRCYLQLSGWYDL
ncbi:MAG: hypothetical protein LBL74_08015 [Bacteroidales bacterium]|jgi:hypothetical protein|nr:hypothetical protein [Bacteroidales bacterium]